MTIIKKLNAKKYNEFESFELDDEYPNLIVGELENGMACVHNVLTGENFFNSETIEKATGLAQSSVSERISSYYEKSTNIVNNDISRETFNGDITDKITLKIKGKDKPVTFHSFDVLTYVVYRSNKAEAIRMRNWIKNALNEKFNEYNDIDLVDMKAKNERLKNKLQHYSLAKKLQQDDFNIALKNGHKEEAEAHKNMIQMYDSKYNRLKTLN